MSPPPNLDFDVVVLGGGFAGVYCAQTLERALGRSTRIRRALIAEENYMVFQPMLAEVAGGSLSAHHVANPLRLLCRRTEVLVGRVEAIDWPARTLRLFTGPLTGHVTVRCQHLVVAVGAVVDLSRIPGMPEHGFLMRNVGDAMLLRQTVVSRLESATLARDAETRQRLLTFVVVGGGYSGVETAGQVLDLVRDAAKLHPRIDADDVRVVLVHSGEYLLPTLVRRLSEYCAQVLRRRGIELRLQVRVQAVTANQVRLSDGGTIAASTVISTVGNAPHPLVLDLIRENDLPAERGRIRVEPTLRVPGHAQLWAAGDCAAVPFVRGGFCPQTAQFAYRQGRLLGRNLAAVLQERTPRTFDFRGLGELATVGHRAAVANILGLNFSGWLAWFLWRTIYLFKLPRLDRKVRVMLDWTLDLFFPREVTLLSPRYSQVLKEIHLEPGDVLFHGGEPAFSLYVVRTGAIELADERGVVAVHRRGDHFGERALLTDQRWLFTARAVEPTKLVSIPAGVFRQLVGSGGSLGRLFQRSAQRHQSREEIDAIARRLPDDVLAQPVRTLMQVELVTLRRNQTIAAAIETLRTHPHSSYPVVDDEGRFVGLLRREDFHDFLRRSPQAGETPLRAIDVASVPTLEPETPMREVVERLVRSGANKLVVVDAVSRLVGMVTVMDLAALSAHTATSA